MDAPDYGIDAPHYIRNGALGIVGGLVLLVAGLAWDKGLLVLLGVLAIYLLAQMIVGIVVSSKVIKPRRCRQMIDELELRGDERVIDIGCGRGMLLIEAARRLDSGTAIGADIWSERDQSGNTAEAARRNITAAGVAERADVVDGDATNLPFEDSSFDVAVSSLTFHNISDDSDRERAIREVGRILRPGGRLALLDMLHTKRYAEILRDAGIDGATAGKPFFLHFSAARIVRGNKPAVLEKAKTTTANSRPLAT